MSAGQDLVAVCACGCNKPLEQARREAGASPGYLNEYQARAQVGVKYVPASEVQS